jgi:hypothetical protein
MQEIETLAREVPKTPEYTMLMDSVRSNPSHNNLVGVRERFREMTAPAPSRLVQDIPVVQETTPTRSVRDFQSSFLDGEEMDYIDRMKEQRIRDSMEWNQKYPDTEGGPLEGRPWPDFLPDELELNPSGKEEGSKVAMTRQGRIYITRPRSTVRFVVGNLGMRPNSVTDRHSANFVHLGPEMPDDLQDFKNSIRNDPKAYEDTRAAGKNLIPEAIKKMTEVHGTVLSDSRGKDSSSAAESIERGRLMDPDISTANTWDRPTYAIRHNKGGNIRGIVDQLRAQGRDIPEEKVQEYLKKYGGSAILAGAGLSAWLEERKNRKEETPLEGEE